MTMRAKCERGLLLCRDDGVSARPLASRGWTLHSRASSLSCPSVAIRAPHAQEILFCRRLVTVPTSPAQLIAMCGNEKNT